MTRRDAALVSVSLLAAGASFIMDGPALLYWLAMVAAIATFQVTGYLAGKWRRN